MRLFASLFVLVLISACRSEETAPMSVEQANAAVAAWRTKHELDYRRDYVSISGLHLLEPGPNLAGSAAGNAVVLPASVPPTVGRFVLDGERVRFEPEPGVRVLLRDSRSPRQSICGTTGRGSPTG
jgi:hypothetical protein